MFSKRIKELRTRKGVTQETMANILGVSPQAISKWEQNVTMPDISMLVPIADYFGVSVDYLLREHTEATKVDPEQYVKVVSKKERNAWWCTVKNISDKELGQVKLKVFFYDKDGNTMDYCDKMVCDLEPNAVKLELLWSTVGAKAASIKVIVKRVNLANEQ